MFAMHPNCYRKKKKNLICIIQPRKNIMTVQSATVADTWFIKINIHCESDKEWHNFRRAWLINLACIAMWASPISPSSSPLGTRAATYKWRQGKQLNTFTQFKETRYEYIIKTPSRKKGDKNVLHPELNQHHIFPDPEKLLNTSFKAQRLLHNYFITHTQTHTHTHKRVIFN